MRSALVSFLVALLALVGLPVCAQTYGGGNQTWNAWTHVNGTTLTATTTTGNVALGGAGPVVYVCNTGSVVTYVKLGNAAVTATSAAYPLNGGACVALAASGALRLAALSASSTAVLLISVGSGKP